MIEFGIFLICFVIGIVAVWSLMHDGAEIERAQRDIDETYNEMLRLLDKRHELIMKHIQEQQKKARRRHT